MDRSVAVVTRSFQRAATTNTIDQSKLDVLCEAIRHMLNCPHVGIVAVVTPSSGIYAEVQDEAGVLPTHAFLGNTFCSAIEDGRLVLVPCDDWGLNAGSATALNAGMRAALEAQIACSYTLFWSPEFQLTHNRIERMVNCIKSRNLELVGYLREGWAQMPQWQMPQNTALLWRNTTLAQLEGMNPSCNGDGVTNVETVEFGLVPRAGMEDVEAYFRLCQIRGYFVPWGMVGQNDPAIWDLSRKVPGTPEHADHLKKVARQWEVVRAYACTYFQEFVYEDVIRQMLEACVAE